MQRKIQDMIRGKFEYDQPVLLLEETALGFSVLEDAEYNGSFVLQSSKDVPIRGMITCEDSYVDIQTKEFDDTRTEILFTFRAENLPEGSTDSGCFVITTNVGEYLLPFTAKITRSYPDSSIGKIRTLHDFSNLCSLNWEEALAVFQSPVFCNIFHENEAYLTLLYQGLTERRSTSHEMEEFLIAVGKKKRNTYIAGEKSRYFEVGSDEIADTIPVVRSGWGYSDVKLYSDASFVILEKNRLQMSDFRGKRTEISYRIDPHMMHRGMNYAAITMETAYQKTRIEIQANWAEEPREHSVSWKKHYIYYRLEHLYTEYLLGLKKEADWKQGMLLLLEKGVEIRPDDRWLQLFSIYIYAKTKEKEKAQELLLAVPRQIRTGRMPQNAFYQYLNWLSDDEFQADPEEREAVLNKIREVLDRYPRHPVMHWLLLQTDPSYEHNPLRRYQGIKKYMEGGSISPIFYAEAALILKNDPDILKSQDAFEFRLIGWMEKKNLLTADLALRIQKMAGSSRTFHKGFLRVLGKCYKKYASDGLVKAVCVYLIHTSHYGEAYFPWFKRGIEQNLKIAGLYEAYMLSWGRSLGELPQQVVRYFSVNHSLPASKKAMLYAYIVRNKSRLGKDWPSYMVMVKNFAVKELKSGHISEDLAIIYEEIRGMMEPEEWNQIRQEAENCYKLYIANTAAVQVHVLQMNPETKRQRIPVLDGSAYIYLHQSPYVILFEDSSGLFYTSKDAERISKMLSGNNICDGKASALETKKQDFEKQSLSSRERLEHMCGPMDEMTELLLKSETEEPYLRAAAKKWMCRLLFTEYMPENHTAVFGILENDPDSYELLRAYASLVSRNQLWYGEELDESVYYFIADRLLAGRPFNPFCETAFLQYYVRHPEKKYAALADHMIAGHIFSNRYFPFFEELSGEIRRKYLLIDLRVIAYCGIPNARYDVLFEDGRKESMSEVLPGMFTLSQSARSEGAKSSMTRADDASNGEAYHILDANGTVVSDGICAAAFDFDSFGDTRYGRIAKLSETNPDTGTQYEYAELCDMVNVLFQPIKE